jgi:Fe-S cluster assembly protein SufB
MTQIRRRSLRLFDRKPMAEWFAVNMPDLDFQDIYYYLRPAGEQVDDWDELPEEMMRTYEKLGIPEAERQYLAGVTAQYECLRGSTRVWTTRGMRAIKELGQGDEVFSLDRETKQVVVGAVRGQACSGDKEIFEIRAGSRSIGASGNHPFLALRDRRRPGRERARYAAEWVEVDDLRPGDYIAVATDLPEYGRPAFLDARHAHTGLGITNVDLAWFMGLYLGDGYVHHRRDRTGDYKSIEIAVDSRDEALIEEITRVGREQFGLEFRLASDEVRLVAPRTKELAVFVETNGLGGVSLTKRVPEWVYGLPTDERLAFLAGFIDADGTVRAHRSAKNPVITSANESLLDDVRELTLLVGIHAGRVARFESAHPFDANRTMVGYRLHLSGRFDRLPLRSWKSDRLGARKYAHTNRTAKGTDFRAHTSEMLGYVRIDSIESIGVEPTYDIEVEGHHNFVAEGFVVHNSEVVYHKNREDLEEQGILFCDMDTALREYPHLVKEYFGSIIPPGDNKFAALNTAVWSGGSFVYIPPGVECEMPLQAYFRINAENAGQFERTLIIADEGSKVHYIEGCSAPVYTSDSLHSAVVEIIVKPHARVTYTTIQNWSPNVYNLVTKRAKVEAHGHMEWIDGNIGCLAEGSTVTTPAGVKPIELLVPGERVLSFDHDSGEMVFRTVTAKRFSGVQPVREVTVGTRSLTVTANHPFLSYSYDPDRPRKLGRYQFAYLRADELTQALVPRTSIDYGQPWKLERPDDATVFTTSNQYADDLPASRARKGRLVLPDHTTDDLMWLFGLFLGDGSLERTRVSFSVPTTDRAYERLIAVMDDLLPGVTAEVRADEIVSRWNSVELVETLERNGLRTGAFAKRIPAWVLDTPESQRLEFLAGLLDSDGCASRGRRGLSFKSANPDLVADVARLLDTLGIVGHISSEAPGPRTIMGYESRSRGAHRLDFTADERLVPYVSPALQEAVAAQRPAQLQHHRTIGRSTLECPDPLEVRKVAVGDHVGEVRTWDIEVEGTGNFVSQGFVVHNSKLTMKYPAVYLVGEGATGEVLSVAYAGEGQHQDAGAKMVHAAPNTSSKIVSKSISKDGGITTYRGLVRVEAGAHGCRSHVECDALILDEDSVSKTLPYMEVGERDAQIGHEATVSKIADDQLFYLMSRGLSEEQAMGMIVNGFIEPITKTLPMEYAVEWSRLIELQMEGSVG